MTLIRLHIFHFRRKVRKNDFVYFNISVDFILSTLLLFQIVQMSKQICILFVTSLLDKLL